MKCKKIIIIAMALIMLTAAAMYLAACSSDDIVTVKFYVDGELYRTYRVEKGGSLDNVPEVPGKEGYKGRWSVNDFDEITESVSVNAIYETDTYTVYFYADGVLIDSVTEKKGKAISRIPAVPEKEGYDGVWSVTVFSGVTTDTTVNAVYTLKPLYATFYRSGKTYVAATVIAGAVPEEGTYYEKDGENYVLTKDKTFSSKKTYYVIKREVYTSVPITDGEIKNVPELPAAENRSVKWMMLERTAEGETFGELVTEGLQKSVEIVAYEYITVNLVDSLNGDTSRGYAEFDVGESVSAVPPVETERDNYDFYGWYFDENLRNKVEFPYAFTANTTLYSKWMSVRKTEGLVFDGSVITGYEGTDTEIYIPYKYENENGEEVTVTAIGGSAFSGNREITTVHVAGTVTKFGNNAFINCSSLEQVLFDDGCYIETLGASVFEGCTELKSVTLCENTTEIGDRAFYGCTMLESVKGIEGTAVSEIAPYAFYNCASVETLKLPGSVEIIGDYAFAYAEKARVTFTDETNLIYIGDYAFAGCKAFNGVSAVNATYIGQKAYEGSSGMTEATFIAGESTHALFGERSLTDDENGFYFVIAEEKEYAIPEFLYSVTFAKGNGKVQSGATVGLNSVKRIVLAEGITEISDGAFAIGNVEATLAAELEVTLPSTLVTIGAEAFSGRTDLSRIDFPASLRTIKDMAFYGTSGLAEVTLPQRNSLETLGRDVFGGTDWYEDYDGLITLGKIVVGISETYCRNRGYTVISASDMGSCEKIAPYAFYGNEILTEIYIGERVNTVGEYAFGGCTSLEVLSFNANASSITQRTVGEGALEGADKLYDLTVYEDVDATKLFANAPESLKILRVNFALKNSALEAEIFTLYGGIEELYIGDGFETIGEGAFVSCSSLKKVAIGKSVRNIGDGAFEGIAGLTELDLGGNTALEEIGNNAFKGTKVNAVTFPDTVVAIGNEAFSGADISALVFGDNLERIGSRAFENNANLKTLNLGNSVKEIGEYAFKGCNISSLTLPSSLESEKTGKGILALNEGFMSLTMSKSASVTAMFTYTEGEEEITAIPVNFATVRILGGEIGEKQFYGISSLQTVTIEKGVSAIGASAFEGCTSIRNINIPGSVIEIGDRAFAMCTNLASCQIDTNSSELRYVGKEVFKGDITLGYAVFPETLESGDWTGIFDGCVALLTTNLPEGITEIGDYAYRNCGLLVTIGMHDEVTAIGQSAFEGCERIDFDDVEFDNLKSVGAYAFKGCNVMHGLKAENAEEIGEGAYYDSNAIEEITIGGEKVSFYTNMPENIVTINVVGNPAVDAFENCDALETAVIYGGEAAAVMAAVQSMDLTKTTVFVQKDIYAEVSAQYNVYVNPTDEANFVFTYNENDFSAVISSIKTSIDGAIYLPGETEKDGTVYTVTGIGAEAFANNSEIESVIIPSSVTEIGTGAFRNCVNLTDLRFESGSRLTIIREAAFESCIGLKKVALPSSLTVISNNAFQSCESLEEVRFFANSGLKEIGAYAFNGAVMLKSVMLKGPIEKIGTNAFNGCISMTEFDYGTKAVVTEISNSTFAGCTALGSVTIPSTVKSIGTNAFRNNSSLATIIIPDSVTTIGNGAFASSGIRSITLGNGLTEIGTSAFESCEKLVTVAIPDTVTTIGESAFKGCFVLEELTIGRRVRTIGAYAFDATRALKTMKYNAVRATDITSGQNIFRYAGQNASVTVIIGKGVRRIPTNLFNSDGTSASAPNIKSVTFEEVSACSEIGSGAFAYLSGLTEITIPVSVLGMGDGVFGGSSSLRVSFEAAKVPAGYSDGWNNGLTLAALFGKNNITNGDYGYVIHENKAYLTSYQGTDTAPVIPSDIGGYEIADIGAAFEENTLIKEIVIPSGITGIGSYYGCVSLEIITIEGDITSIPDRAFYGCVSLDNVVIPEGVTEIGEQAFYGCEGLTTVYVKSAGAAELLSGEAESGYITAYAVSLYVVSSVSETGIDETVYTKLPVTSGEYSVYTKLYYTAGDNVNAFLLKENSDDEYSLNIIGSGNMTDYAALALVPWNKYTGEIVKLTIGSGIRVLGRNAFVSLTALREIYYNAQTATYNENKNLFKDSGSGDGIILTVGDEVENIPAHLFRENQKLKEIIYEGEKLTKIRDYAFYGCNGLETVLIPDSVITIGAYAFGDGKNIKEITIGTGVKEIGTRAFYGADNMTAVNYNATEMNGPEGNMSVFDSSVSVTENGGGFTVNVGANVKIIPAYAFYDCGNLIGINFPTRGAITEIGKEAFYKCDSLVSLTLPATIETISERAFAESSALSDISFGTGTVALKEIGREALLNTAYYSNENNWETNGGDVTSHGVLYLLGRYLIRARIGLSGEYTISGNTVLVANEAFEGCGALEYIRIPTAVEYIGEGAFDGCTRLKTVYVSSYAAAEGFAEAKSFGGVIENALHVYIARTLVDDRNVKVGDYLKKTFTAISETVTFTAGIYYAYTKAAWTTGDAVAYLINDEVNPGYYEINVKGEGKMADYSLNDMMPWRDYLSAISKATVQNGVTAIGSTSFYNCVGMKEISIARSVETIGADAFNGCESLQSLEIPENINTIGNNAFANCVSLKTLTYLAIRVDDLEEDNGIFASAGNASESGIELKIAREVKYIPAYLFYPYVSGERTPSVRNVEFLSVNNINDCEEIGRYAFANLTELQSIKFAKGATLKSIDEGAFENCTSLSMLEITAGITYIGKRAFASCYMLGQIVFSATDFAEGEEGNVAFAGAGAAVEEGITLTVSNKTKYIPSYLFEDASYLKTLDFETDGICESIGINAFEDCISLGKVVIPDNVISIGESAFSGCKSITSYTAPFIGGKAEAVEASITTLFGYVFGSEEKDGTTGTSQSYGSGKAYFYVPDSITYVEITKYINLYYGSFSNCVKIRSVVLNASSNIDMIYEYGVNEAGQQYIIQSIANGSIVGNEAFSGCVSLTEANLTGRATEIGASAFKDCILLSEITIPENVKSIGESAFENCRALTKIYFNSTACGEMYVGESQTSARSINVFANVGTDKNGTEVVFGKGVTKVPSYMFAVSADKTSPKLSKISFAEGTVCEEIGERAFYGAGTTTLTDITLPDTLKKIGDGAFEETAYYRDKTTKWESGVLYIGNCLIKANLQSATEVAEYSVKNGTTLIADRAFYNCRHLAKVNIPSTVAYIGDYAFASCSGLKDLQTEASSSLTRIGNYAFSKCILLGSEINDEKETIGFYLRGNVSEIGFKAFYDCTELTKLYLDSAFVAGNVTGNGYEEYGGILKNAVTIYISQEVTGTSSFIINNYETSGAISGGYRKYVRNN